MIRLIRSLPPGAEFVIVVLGAFGMPILNSTIVLFFPPPTPSISESSLRFLIVQEALVFFAVAWFLHVREWTPQHLGMADVTLWDVLTALGLFVALYMANILIRVAVQTLLPDAINSLDASRVIAHGLRPTTVIVLSILNATYEEVFVCGYVISALKDRRPSQAIELSVAIRLLYHTYQGSVGMISIAPLGFAFGWYYARSRRLWPIVLAHALFDLCGLSPFIGF